MNRRLRDAAIDAGEAEVDLLVDEAGDVLGAVTADGDSTPVVVVDADLSFAEFADSDAVTLLDLGARFVALAEAGRPIGLVPVETIGAYLAGGDYAARPTTMSGAHGGNADGSLHGDPQVGTARVRCAHPGCGHINTLTFFDPDRPPPCASPVPPPHPLAIG